MKKGKLFIISATSGAGKTTLGRYILDVFPELKWSVSATTRKKRDGEIDGKDYFFISQNEFENKIKTNQFLEYAINHSGGSAKHYGTLRSSIEKTINSGKSILCDIDVQGFSQIQKNYSGEVVSIFIKAPSIEIAKKRLISRGTNSLKQIEERLNSAENELKQQGSYDYIIINNDLETAKNEIKKIFKTHLE